MLTMVSTAMKMLVVWTEADDYDDNDENEADDGADDDKIAGDGD